MRYLKLFKLFEFVKFEQGRMTDWSNWLCEEEIEEVQSLFPESLFRDINDILDSISERMSVDLNYDVIEEGNDKLLLINILFERKGSGEVLANELVDTLYHLKEYLRENVYVNTKFSILLDDGESYSEKGENIDSVLDELMNSKEKVNKSNIEFLSRVK